MVKNMNARAGLKKGTSKMMDRSVNIRKKKIIDIQFLIFNSGSGLFSFSMVDLSSLF